jgi:hypothetical protein
VNYSGLGPSFLPIVKASINEDPRKSWSEMLNGKDLKMYLSVDIFSRQSLFSPGAQHGPETQLLGK